MKQVLQSRYYLNGWQLMMCLFVFLFMICWNLRTALKHISCNNLFLNKAATPIQPVFSEYSTYETQVYSLSSVKNYWHQLPCIFKFPLGVLFVEERNNGIFSSSDFNWASAFPFLVGHRYIGLFLCSQPDMEDVSGRSWAGSESGGENFDSGNSGGKKIGSWSEAVSGLLLNLPLIQLHYQVPLLS